MTITSFRIAGLSLLFCLSARVCWGQIPSNPILPKTNWMNAPWTNTDRNLKKTRVQVTNSFTATRQKDWPTLVSRWATKAQAKPQDVDAVFGWSVAAFSYATRSGKRDYRQLGKVQKHLDQSSRSDSYEFARMRYLISALNFSSSQLLPIGKRLYKRNRKDYDVAYFLVDMFNMRDSEEKKQATAVAHQLVRLAPTRPSAHASLGWVYFRSWMGRHNPRDASSATSAYNRYLQLAPKSDPFRPKAQRLIAMMKAKT